MSFPPNMLLLLYNDAMLSFFKTFPKNLVASFQGRLIFYHLLAILLTILLVLSGFDWRWYLLAHTKFTQALSFPAIVVGSFLPIVLPVCIIAIAILRKDKLLSLKGWLMGQAALIALIISSTYKAFTGRIPPTMVKVLDISHQFNFGFFRQGIFWGWPSSHTATNFALATAFFFLFSRSKWRWPLLIFALYVGLGVSTGIHWFSEFVAGALIGWAIGLGVGKSTSNTLLTDRL
jgi:membrane-associated phospholipid phosphatase